jgi:hypothetical protein
VSKASATPVSLALRNRAEGIERYTAFGLTIEGPRRFLDGHCEPLPADAEAGQRMRLEVLHDTPASAIGWRTLVTHDPERARQHGHRFLALLEDPSGQIRRYRMINELTVDASPAQGWLRVHAPAMMHPDTLGAFVIGTAMLCYFKAWRRLCLHAAVLSRDQIAVLLCGPSGAGKSSLAAAMQARGWRVVVEDLAVLEWDGPVARVRPGYGRVRLWRDSVEGLALDERASQIAYGADKHYLPVRTQRDWSPALSRLVFLRERIADGVDACQNTMLSSSLALARLYGNSLATYLNPPAEVPGLLQSCRQLATALPCEELRLADGWSRMAQACESLDQYWRSAPIVGDVG